LPFAQDIYVLAPESELVSEEDDDSIYLYDLVDDLDDLGDLGGIGYKEMMAEISEIGLFGVEPDDDDLEDEEESPEERSIDELQLTLFRGTHEEKLEALRMLEDRGDEALSLINAVFRLIMEDIRIREEALDTFAKIAERSEEVVPRMLKYVGIHTMEMILNERIPSDIKMRKRNKSGLPKIGALPITGTTLDLRYAAALILIKIGTPKAINPLKKNMARLYFPSEIKEEFLKKIADAESKEEGGLSDFSEASSLRDELENSL